MKTALFAILKSMLTRELIESLVIYLLKELAKMTDSKVDDKLVEIIEDKI